MFPSSHTGFSPPLKPEGPPAGNQILWITEKKQIQQNFVPKASPDMRRRGGAKLSASAVQAKPRMTEKLREAVREVDDGAAAFLS